MGINTSSLEGLTAEQELRLIVEYFHTRGMSVQDAFRFLDVDSSGTITWDEFYRGVLLCTQGMNSSSLTPAVLANTFNHFDVNHDGSLSIEEFAVAFYSVAQTQPLAPLPPPPAPAFESTIYPLLQYPPAEAPQPDAAEQGRRVEDLVARIACSVVRTGHTPQELFNKLDLDHNGKLSRDELQQLMLALEPNLSRTDIEAIFWRFDKDFSGEVDVFEFYEALQTANPTSLVAVEEKVKALGQKFGTTSYNMSDLFAVFDRNGDSFLSKEEWHRALSLFGPEVSPADAEAVFSRFDVNQDGFLSIAEFQAFFQTSIDLQPQTPLPLGTIPTYVPPPVEAPWEAEILDFVRSCLSSARSGMTITQVFRQLDISNSNTMTPFEFNRMITAYRPDLSPEHLQSLFAKVNTSGSGVISVGEFVRRFG